MPTRKATRAKKSKPAKKKKAAPKSKKSARPKKAVAKKPFRAQRPAPRRRPARRTRTVRSGGSAPGSVELIGPARRGSGPDFGGQSGDVEGLPEVPDADSESVEELAAEGQDFEAELVDAVEGAPDPDEAEVETREIPENDVPEEYKDDRGNR